MKDQLAILVILLMCGAAIAQDDAAGTNKGFAWSWKKEGKTAGAVPSNSR